MAEIHSFKQPTNRDTSGQFSHKSYGEKKLRSMKLTDHAWDALEAIGFNEGISRTDVIEKLTRGDYPTIPDADRLNNDASIVAAMEEFIKSKKAGYGKNPAQRGKEFSTNSRSWDMFNEFFEIIKAKLTSKL